MTGKRSLVELAAVLDVELADWQRRWLEALDAGAPLTIVRGRPAHGHGVPDPSLIEELLAAARRDADRANVQRAASYRECHEALTRRERLEPCERPAIGVRRGEGGDPYPVCTRHARGPMVTLLELADVLSGAPVKLHAPPRTLDPCPVCRREVKTVDAHNTERGPGPCFARPCGHRVDVTIWPDRVQLEATS